MLRHVKLHIPTIDFQILDLIQILCKKQNLTRNKLFIGCLLTHHLSSILYKHGMKIYYFKQYDLDAYFSYNPTNHCCNPH
jgi:hypothetical protein